MVTFDSTWKSMVKQSERQLGAFLFLYALENKGAYVIDDKMVAFRNKVIHQGYIPKEKEADAFGEHVFQQIRRLTKMLETNFHESLNIEIKTELDNMESSAPKGLTQIRFKATLVNMNPKTNVAQEITEFSDHLRGIRNDMAKWKNG